MNVTSEFLKPVGLLLAMRFPIPMGFLMLGPAVANTAVPWLVLPSATSATERH